ncbi:hypothetical protein PL10110_740017 [Planktothrix agardhii]|uniref:hypothetical protein n=1 Tax=Planktothrix agardhii TaxID=1160 RepID=UPI001B9CBF7D|nr:hypothetical protein [Planktothrix agardhii]CAD0232378.1 hypothetical protein PL10110_740017 [Planktothrix agardhii]
MTSCPRDKHGKLHCEIIDHPDRDNQTFCNYCKRRFSESSNDFDGVWAVICVLFILLLVLILAGCSKQSTKLLSTPEQRNQKENQVWIELLIHQHNQVLKQGQKAIQEKRRQLNQSPVGLISREAWETAINEEIKAITEEFQLELYQIQSELKRRGYSMESNQVLSTEKMNTIKHPKWQLKPDSQS